MEATVVTTPSDTADEFDAWVGPHLVVMARVAARLAPAADRDDILQDALTAAWKRRTTYDPAKGTPTAWLCAIVANTASRAAGRRPTPVRVVADEAASPADSDLALDVADALSRLSQRQREVVDLYYYAGLTVAETAAVMGCSTGTVKSTLHDARTRLRTLLGDHR